MAQSRDAINYAGVGGNYRLFPAGMGRSQLLNRLDLPGKTFSAAFFCNDTQSLNKVIATSLVLNIFRPPIPKQLMCCNAPGASIRALRGKKIYQT